MATVTLTTLRSLVREQADMTGSTFITDAAASVDSFINRGIQKLHDIVIQKVPNQYFVSSSNYTTTSGTSLYALPSDFYRLLGVDLQVGVEMVDLRRFDFKERNSKKLTFNAGMIPEYMLEGSYVRLYPAPAGAYSGVIWYIPVATVLSSGSDSVNYPNGWEEIVVLYAAMLARIKEESDITELKQLFDEKVASVVDVAENRDSGEPAQAIDIETPMMGTGLFRRWRF